MADNVGITDSAGVVHQIATDDVTIDGVPAEVQRVKPMVGIGGSAGDVSVSNPMPVGSERIMFKEDFNGGVLNNDWWSTTTGAGQTVTETNSELRITTGTTSGAETIVTSRFALRMPVRVLFTAFLSQRIANQEFYLELVNLAGTAYISWKFDGTSATTGRYVVATDTASIAETNATVTIPTTASYQMFEIDSNIDETSFRTRVVDSTSIAGVQATRTRNTPIHEDLYIRIRAKNTAAAASTTTLSLDNIIIQDINELFAEITSGRGQLGANNAVAVQLTGGTVTTAPTTTVRSLNAFNTESVANVAAAASTSATPTARDLNLYDHYRVAHFADQPGTVLIETSYNNTAWHTYLSQTTVANTHWESGIIRSANRYYRVRWTNTGAATTTVQELTSILVG